MKIWKYIILLILLIAISMNACTSQVPQSTPSSDVTSSSGNTAIIPPAVLPANRVEVVYFYMPQRCGTCLCFEERSVYVVDTYFQSEMASGRLVFQVCDLSDRKKAALIRKYDAFAPQLFINTIVDNVDHIKNIEDIWNWHCVADKQGFDTKVRTLIEQALKDVG